MTDDIVVIFPRREAQGLFELLENGLAPKPTTVLMLHTGKPAPPILVALKTVFPTVYAALENALKVEEPNEENPDA